GCLGCYTSRLLKKGMLKCMVKRLMLVILLQEMLVLLMEKFLLLLKNHPFHLLHHPLYHHNHFIISLPLPKHNQHLHNHLSEIITAVSITITAAEAQVPAATLTAALSRVTTALSRRRKIVVIRDPQEESTTSTIIPAETKSKDKGKRILVKEPKPLKKQQQIEQDEKYARELEAELNKNIDWDEAIDHVNKKEKEDNVVKRYQALKRKLIRPVFERYFDSNVAFLKKTKEQIEEEESRALKRINETPTERAAKRQKLDEEVEELKRHLQIVPNEDDDVYTEATLLARKVPVVDYEIINMNNKSYYKIIRADGTHQLYIITFITTQLILLVERKYPLTRFTLEQMLNAVRLKVKEESEVSLELLRFTRQQHQERQLE
nr:hypothetical protein [Tanacetum cinerariifolium]